ncbi:hypothetical protein LWI29_009372 [Acer saccharum]|uniref:CASP-like protein n=1 Tax=Acer saccharum TaxID=4024 RepID=A0AA39SUI4_ACESA|nr:hypothetical protein LWI29_009372 [Acer saccharum]
MGVSVSVGSTGAVLGSTEAVWCAVSGYLAVMSAIAAAYSLLQLLITGSRLLKNAPVIPSRRQAWLILAADQIFAYALVSAGSVAFGITNLNRTGINHTALPNFCKALPSFCDHIPSQ